MKNNKSLGVYTRQCYKCGVIFRTESKSYGKRVCEVCRQKNKNYSKRR